MSFFVVICSIFNCSYQIVNSSFIAYETERLFSLVSLVPILFGDPSFQVFPFFQAIIYHFYLTHMRLLHRKFIPLFLTTWPLFFYQKLLIVHTTVYYATPHLQCLILRNSYTMGWNCIWHSILVSNFLRFHEIFFLKYHPIICKYVVWILWKYLKKTVLKL